MADFDDVVQRRRSIRAFDPNRPVPAALLREVFELAQRAPSNCNAQPWQVIVVSGERRDRLSRALVAAARAGQAPDEAATPSFAGAHRQRQIACAAALYEQIGVSREDREGRARASLRNFEFFDAPHLAVICMDRSFGLGVALDVGAYLQTFMLAAWSRGIGSCAQASLKSYASLVQQELEIPEHLRVLCGVSFGYELLGAAANRVVQARSPIDEHVTFLS
jgi:nitroreductase